MSFMLNDLKDELPADFIEDFEQSPFELRYRGRDRVSGANFWHYRLCEQWYKIKTANKPGAVSNYNEIIAAEYARIKRFTPACPDIGRGVGGPDSRSRSYLNETEEYFINIGTGEYNHYCDYENPKLSQMQRNLKARLTDTQSPQQNHVLNWLFSMDECQQLGPNAFDTCDCGIKAVIELKAYREELEHGLIPASFFLSEFPITYVPQEVICARLDMKVRNKEGTDDDRIPRCQKIFQDCKLHEMESNNIFVLVDTSVDNINDRLSDPEGPLPAPGQMISTKFPLGYHTQPRFLMIPYDILTRRCEHGHPEDFLFGPSCDICLPNYQEELRKNEALVGLSQDNDGDFRREHGFRNVPPLFQVRHPPGH